MGSAGGPPDSASRYDALIDTPFDGLSLGIRLRGDALDAIDFLPPQTTPVRPASEPARNIVRQLRRYFQDPAAGFDLPLAPAGTPFQQRVRRALIAIPPGQVASYGELSRRLGSSPRAVGAACRANPLPLVVPCHRVVAARGAGGFGGAAAGPVLQLKCRLIEHEGGAAAVYRSHAGVG